jgi:superfamily II DNA or RNA helicase
VSDNLTPEHRANLERLGILPAPRSTPKPRPRFQCERAPNASLFAPPPLPTIEEMNLTPLYSYQQAALERVWEAIEAGKKRIILMLPTGGGKTVLAAHIFAHRGQQGNSARSTCPC